MKKRGLAFLLALIMMLALVPVTAMADDNVCFECYPADFADFKPNLRTGIRAKNDARMESVTE